MSSKKFNSLLKVLDFVSRIFKFKLIYAICDRPLRNLSPYVLLSFDNFRNVYRIIEDNFKSPYLINIVSFV